MIVVGFNATHDGAAVLVRDGAVVAAVEEERFSREKHHHGFPAESLRFVTKAAGVDWKDVDAAAFYWNPWRGTLRFGWHFLKSMPRSLQYLRMQPGIFSDFVRMKGTLGRAVDFRGAFHFVDHHLGHAASAFYPSPFDRAAVLTVDGTGEWTTTWLGVGEGDRLHPLRSIGYPHSLGKLYEALTQYLGFRVNSGEGKVMGLASYGEPRFRDAFAKLIRPTNGGGFRLDMRYFQYQFGAPIKYAPALVDLLGPAREPESELDDRHRDIAATLQAITEERLLALADELHRLTGERRLCLAGGVALNCVANGRLLRESPFHEIWVQPAAHDSGAGLGAALVVAQKAGDDVRKEMRTAALGTAFDDDHCREAVRAAGVRWSEPPSIVDAVAETLAGGAIVGWFQGRAEFGPRALGHRSILADPRPKDMKDRLNARVKHREGFRPFAPAVLLESAGAYFDGCGGTTTSPFMLKAFPVVESKRALIPAVTHVDGTARVQTVDRADSPLFHALIRAFASRTGVPVLVNTSFNRRGEPIVETPAQALTVFLESEMDAVAIGPCWVTKPMVAASR